MTPHRRRLNKARALGMLTFAGSGCVFAGVYLLFGLPVTLIVAGVAGVAVGLLVDAG